MPSRYAYTDVAEVSVPDGRGGRRDVRYLRRRVLPDPDTLLPIALHTVAASDRLDLISARYLERSDRILADLPTPMRRSIQTLWWAPPPRAQCS